MSSEESFCGATLQNVRTYFFNLQGTCNIDIPICIISVIINMFNILVFTRRNMTSPVNLIFTHLAFANLSELLASASLTWIDCAYYRTMMTLEGWTYTQAFFALRSIELASIFNNIGVYIILMLAIWKYIVVFHPSKESQWCNMKTTRNSLVVGYIICILFEIPGYLSHYIEIVHPEEKIYIYRVETVSIMYSVSQMVLYELLPSLVLPVLGVRLIASLWSEKNHSTPSSNVENRTDSVKMNQKTNRSIIISMIIVAQCLSFVIPAGLLDLARHTVLANDYYSIHHECFASFQVILNLLEIVNKSIKFIVYYAMDQDFRVTFKSLFNKNHASVWKLKYVPLSSTRGNDESLEIGRF
ncbi:uncharacterized protein LOC135844465 [Planococcus citri]|uniref:uncharacterized protein LOC135844465 n=1 Tax=Planococcus citri TaxID=170843 RepID=UPI0031F7A7BF